MKKERAIELLEYLVCTIADRTELDVAMEWMKISGFTQEEIEELGFGYED